VTRRLLLAAFAVALGSLLQPTAATADGTCLGCRVLAISFTIDTFTAPPEGVSKPPQIVMWLETPAGDYVETSVDGAPIFITQQTGTFGLGNRPGRYDFNSGPLWPYGRRETVFPIWAHRHAAKWGNYPRVGFQSGTENDLSHPMNLSSTESHFCRPLRNTGQDKLNWDAGTCASASYTDKGRLSPSDESMYPPRADITHSVGDSADVSMYGVLNDFDAVSQATPMPGTDTVVTWPIPQDFPFGDYVLFIEVSREFDFNPTYNPMAYPAPAVVYGDYGLPYRGQPSVLYRVPVTITLDGGVAQIADYAGYGDPEGLDGDVRPPDATITTDVPGSGAGRFAMVADASGSYRVRAEVEVEHDCIAPSAATDLSYEGTAGRISTIAFTAPGDDGTTGTARGYEVRYQVGDDITEANFDQAQKLTTSIVPEPSGMTQVMPIDTLLPETEYIVAIRAFDNCHNEGPISTLRFTTPARKVGEVDACFVATAAYGSLMANDVGMLRHFRDAILRNSALGELAVESYYTFGPSVAGLVGESDLLRSTARDLLAPIVARVKTAAF
jgi:hypothetical protein